MASGPNVNDVRPDPSPTVRGHTAFAYVFEGEAAFDDQKVSQTRLVVLGDGDYVKVVTAESPVRFLLVSGKPLNEPIARYGPFVMNTRGEIEQALRDLRQRYLRLVGT